MITKSCVLTAAGIRTTSLLLVTIERSNCGLIKVLVYRNKVLEIFGRYFNFSGRIPDFKVLDILNDDVYGLVLHFRKYLELSTLLSGTQTW